MKKKKLFAIIVTTILVGVTGCSSASSTSPTSTGINIGNSSVKVSALTQWAHLYEDNNYCDQFIEEHLGINIQMERVDITDTDKVRVLFDVSVPEFFTSHESSAYIHGNGYARTIPVSMVREYVPSLMAYFDEYPTLYASALSANSTTQFDNLIGVDETSIRIALYADMYRYDWILDSGIDLGVEVVQITDHYYVAKEGLTKDTFEEIMEYFVYGDPDKNGVDDTYGASLYAGASLRTSLTSGFGFIPGINEVDGVAVQHYEMDEYKESISWFADLYQRGLIDEEWFTQDTYRVWNKVETNQTGFWQSSTNAMNAWAVARPPSTLIASNPDVKILLTTGLQDDEGNVTMKYSSSTMARKNYYVGADVSDEKLALILQMYEFCNYSEAAMTLWFGEEEVDWRYNESGEFELLNELDAGEKGVKTFAQDTQVGELWEAITLEEDFVKGAEFWLDDGVWLDDYVYQYKEDIRKESNYAVVLAEKGDEINDVVNTYFQDCVTGAKSVNATWTAYLRELDAAGYSELIKELEKVPPLLEIIEEYGRLN